MLSLELQMPLIRVTLWHLNFIETLHLLSIWSDADVLHKDQTGDTTISNWLCTIGSLNLRYIHVQVNIGALLVDREGVTFVHTLFLLHCQLLKIRIIDLHEIRHQDEMEVLE